MNSSSHFGLSGIHGPLPASARRPASSTRFSRAPRFESGAPEAAILAIGRGVFELAGFPETELIGRDVIEAMGFSDPKPVDVALEWGVRRMGEQLSIRTRTGSEKPVVADVFPAYDDDGGLLIALTPKR